MSLIFSNVISALTEDNQRLFRFFSHSLFNSRPLSSTFIAVEFHAIFMFRFCYFLIFTFDCPFDVTGNYVGGLIASKTKNKNHFMAKWVHNRLSFIAFYFDQFSALCLAVASTQNGKQCGALLKNKNKQSAERKKNNTVYMTRPTNQVNRQKTIEYKLNCRQRAFVCALNV